MKKRLNTLIYTYLYIDRLYILLVNKVLVNNVSFTRKSFLPEPQFP